MTFRFVQAVKLADVFAEAGSMGPRWWEAIRKGPNLLSRRDMLLTD